MLRDQTWVLTGAAGRVASQVRRLRLVDVVPVAAKNDGEEAMVADLRDPDATQAANTDMPPRPDGLYGVSKIAGEALARMYAEKFGLSVIAVRIGSAEDTPQDVRQLSTWLSPGDCRAAFLAAMRARDVSYAAFYAVSRNSRRWWDLTAGSRLLRGVHAEVA
jgi:nucleoside-diphosphate-sugar epimerase